MLKQKKTAALRLRLKSHGRKLFLERVVFFLFDEGQQLAAVFGLSDQSKALLFAFSIRLGIDHFSLDFLAGLDIIKRVLHGVLHGYRVAQTHREFSFQLPFSGNNIQRILRSSTEKQAVTSIFLKKNRFFLQKRAFFPFFTFENEEICTKNNHLRQRVKRFSAKNSALPGHSADASGSRA